MFPAISDRGRLRSVGLVACLLAFALFAGGCSANADDAAESLQAAPTTLAYREGLVIGLAIQSQTRAFSKALRDGAQEYAAEVGAGLIVADADGSPAQQLASVESLIDAGVDAIILSPVDSRQATSIAKVVADAGLPLLAVSNQIGSVDDFGAQYVYPGTVGLVANDDLNMGRIAAGFVQEPVGANIAVLQGNPSAANSNLRLAGFTSALDALGVDYSIKSRLTGHWEADGAKPACEAFAAMPEIDLVFSMSDEMTTGCVSHFQAVARHDVQFVSIGGSLQGLTMLTIGYVLGTVCQAPSIMGATAVETMLDAFSTGDFNQGLKISVAKEVTRKTMEECKVGW